MSKTIFTLLFLFLLSNVAFSSHYLRFFWRANSFFAAQQNVNKRQSLTTVQTLVAGEEEGACILPLTKASTS